MLQHISSTRFFETILFLTAIWYAVIAIVYYPKEMGKWIRRMFHRIWFNEGKGS